MLKNLKNLKNHASKLINNEDKQENVKDQKECYICKRFTYGM